MPELESKRGIVLRVLSPGGLNPAPTDPFLPTAELSAVGICLPAERLRMHELEEENRVRLPPDVAKTKGYGLTSTQSIAYTGDNSMARLHNETIPTSTLAATARVVDGFVTTQTDHQGITSSFTRAYTVTGVTLTATDGRGNTTTTHTDPAGHTISSTDAAGNTTTTVYDAAFDAPPVITNAQGKTACYKYDLRGRKVAEWGTAIQSPRGLGGGLDKRAAFAPQGRAANGVAASQRIQWSSEYNDSELGLVYYNYRHYNPADGRWLSRGKQGEHADPNLYILVGNSTICNTDQRGEWFFVAAAIIQGRAIQFIIHQMDTES